MIGSPFGPCRYGGRLEVSFFLATTKTITVTTTAKAGPGYVDMAGRSEQGERGSRGIILPVTADGLNGSVDQMEPHDYGQWPGAP